MKNRLKVDVTRPSQKLIVMRGIPGAGKSTEAKKLVGEGVIHSTDTLIENSMNYRVFFEQMLSSGDFKPLSRMHSQNLKNVKESLINGIEIVVVDNTNIKQNEAKAYVKTALELGLSDDNIIFVDIGTNGLSAKVLAERNTHGVPLAKIEQMIANHKGQGKMTLESVLNSKDMYKNSNVLYSCVLLDKASHTALLEHDYPVDLPDGWINYAHHMTINLGPLKDSTQIGKTVMLTVTEIGISDMAMAVAVSGYPSSNAKPHVTLAINPDGGKPVMSNNITKWQPIKHFFISGVVTEIKKQ